MEGDSLKKESLLSSVDESLALVHALRDAGLQGRLSHEGDLQTDRRWFGFSQSGSLHRMQNVPDGLSLWNPSIREERKDAEM
jgi:hypothetical protein